MKLVSIVIPVYNETENLEKLYYEIKDSTKKNKEKFEFIFVNDASTDSTLDKLKKLRQKDKSVKIISLLGNHGQTLALSAGFKNCKGDIIIAMDGDCQHDPKYIPKFIQGIEEGYDVVSGWKKKDKSRSLLTYLLSKSAHKLISLISGAKMQYFGATMKAYKKEVVKKLELNGDLHRFAGALVYYKGIRIKEFPIKIRSRFGGTSSYSLSKTLKVILDLFLIYFLVKYSKTPFRLFSVLGISFGIIGTIGILDVFIRKILFNISTAGNTALLIVSSMSIMIGVQSIIFGLISEQISRVYNTANNKEFFTVREKVGI